MGINLKWNTSSIPNQQGKVYIITGANTGIGYAAAKTLAAKNARVYMASRNRDKQQKACEDIKREFPYAQVEWLECDLGNLRSVQECSEEFKRRNEPLHCLINSAGVIDPPDDSTPEGFEVTMGINYFGAFYLTHLLADKLLQQPRSRIVFENSISEVHGELHWDDLIGAKAKRSDYMCYANSKLFLMMFCGELQRRLRSAGSSIDCMSAHPGISSTDIFRKQDKSKPSANVLDVLGNNVLARIQPPERGCHSMLYAATEPALTGDGGAHKHYGPTYLGLQPPPVALCLNLFNIDYRQPQNSWAQNPTACQRLYDETLAIVNAKAPKQISAVDAIVRQKA